MRPQATVHGVVFDILCQAPRGERGVSADVVWGGHATGVVPANAGTHTPRPC